LIEHRPSKSGVAGLSPVYCTQFVGTQPSDVK